MKGIFSTSFGINGIFLFEFVPLSQRLN